MLLKEAAEIIRIHKDDCSHRFECDVLIVMLFDIIFHLRKLYDLFITRLVSYLFAYIIHKLDHFRFQFLERWQSA